MKDIINLVVNDYNSNIRLDKFLSVTLEDYSRSYLQKLIKNKFVTVNDKIVKSNYKLSYNDKVIIYIPEPEELEIIAQDIKLDIVYEDKDIIIINKPQGIVVHPAPGNYDGTIVNAILHHCKDELSGINGVLRPGIVHRIDKDTSGLLVICKNDKAHIDIAQQLKEHTITRKYEAIVYHNVKDDEGCINAPIGRHQVNRKQMAINYKNGKEAVTHYKVLERLKDNKFTYVELQLETGRTHQIRVHMTSINHPLVGDPVYGPQKSKFKLEGQLLHAKTLGFIHPTSKEYIEFNAPLPDYFKNILKVLSN
jgi:23S rRNA pseudouridine1911/1915/1917 synthase